MVPARYVAPLCALTMLAACEAKFGERADADGTGNAVAAAAGKAEDGQFSIKAPGIDMKIDIPKGIADNASIEGRNDILYPGARLAGLHVEANDEGSGGREAGVELRFTSGDAPDKVAAWYRDGARAQHFSIVDARQEESGYRLNGKDEDGDPFTLSLMPRASGGTDGRLLLQDRS